MATTITYNSMAETLRKVLPKEDEAVRRVRLMLQRAMLIGLNTVRRPTNTPKLTGQLIRSTSVSPVKRSGQELSSTMTAAVEYARRQEFEHPTKSKYLLRGIQTAADKLQSDLSDARNILAVDVRAGI